MLYIAIWPFLPHSQFIPMHRSPMSPPTALTVLISHFTLSVCVAATCAYMQIITTACQLAGVIFHSVTDIYEVLPITICHHSIVLIPCH